MFRKAVTIDFGPHEGMIFRTARKPHPCNASSTAGRCKNVIEAGERYMETETIFDTPFQRTRYCLACSGAEARESLVAWLRKEDPFTPIPEKLLAMRRADERPVERLG